MTTRCYVMLGGFWGFDGGLTSAGMMPLAQQIGALPNVSVATMIWSAMMGVAGQIMQLPKDMKVAIVGYSGGGMAAAAIANRVDGRPIDLIVGLDPSPRASVERFADGNVKKAICFYNETPFFLGYGGGVFRGPSVEIRRIRMNHISVQFDPEIRRQTVEAVGAMEN